jgi:hypothetical protein
MIVTEEDQNLLAMHVYGELTLADFLEFETAVTDELKTYPQINLLFDLTNMSGFTVDMAWEDIQFNKQHMRDFRKIAIVTDDQWIAWLSWLSGQFTDAEVQTFPDINSATGWLQGA